MSDWQPIETAPVGSREMFVVKAFDVRPHDNAAGMYTSDAYCVFRNASGGFERWPHPFGPTHWLALPSRSERGAFEAWYRAEYDSTLYCESAWRGWKARSEIRK